MNFQKLTDLVDAIREWERFGRKGTRPRKVRANSNEFKRASRNRRVKLDRKRRATTKAIQRTRVNRGQQVNSGRK